MRQVLVSGVSLSYELDGPAPSEGAGPPLVLLHGFPLDARAWADVARSTSRKVATYRPNLRGFGSLTSMEPFTIDSLAADVAELLRKLGLGRCILAGVSMGGYVALSFAEQFPDRLAALALVDSRADADDESARSRRDEMIALVRRSGAGSVAQAIYPNLLASGTYERNPALAESLMRIMADTPAPTIEHACRAMRDRPDRTDLLRAIRVPAAVVVGQEDRITPPDVARAMSEALPNGELLVVPDAGHMTPLEQPERVAQALLHLADRAAATAHVL